MSLIEILAQTVPPATGPATRPSPPPGWFAFLAQWGPIILIILVFYFLVFGSKKKQERQRQDMLNQLKKDDEVMTNGGIWGRIVSLEDKVATLEIADKVKIRIMRDRIAGRWNPGETTPPR